MQQSVIFYRHIRANFGIPNKSQFPDIGKNPGRGISNFRISGQSLIKENCHNSRTCGDIDMKLVPVTKLDKRNKTRPKKFGHDFMPKNYNVIVIFLIYGQFGASRKPDSEGIVYKIYIFIDSNLLCYKNWKQTKTSLTQLLLWVKVLFWPKNAGFLQKNADTTKIKKTLNMKLNMDVYLCAKFF